LTVVPGVAMSRRPQVNRRCCGAKPAVGAVHRFPGIDEGCGSLIRG
jgi:hypothetical protein